MCPFFLSRRFPRSNLNTQPTNVWGSLWDWCRIHIDPQKYTHVVRSLQREETLTARDSLGPRRRLHQLLRLCFFPSARHILHSFPTDLHQRCKLSRWCISHALTFAARNPSATHAEGRETNAGQNKMLKLPCQTDPGSERCKEGVEYKIKESKVDFFLHYPKVRRCFFFTFIKITFFVLLTPRDPGLRIKRVTKWMNWMKTTGH